MAVVVAVTPGVDPPRPTPAGDGARLRLTARVLQAMAVVRDLATRLDAEGIPVMVLKGPHLQQRLYGTPTEYPSGDIDVLVRGRDGAKARRLLVAEGWSFEAQNGVLWRASRAATYAKDHVRIDLHWGMHAAHLASPTLRPFERALWAHATKRSDGLLEPTAEALVVYLAMHAAGHGYERSTWTRNVTAAAALVRDWDAVWRLAHEVHLGETVRHALAVADGGPAPTRNLILDGWRGEAAWTASYLARGHVLPRPVRAAAAGLLERLPPMPFGSAPREPSLMTFGPIEISVEFDVFPPQAITERLAENVCRHLSTHPAARPRVLDVGTGTGAVALAIASQHPKAEILAFDISASAVGCARRNARRLGARNVSVVRSDLLRAMPSSWNGTVSAIAANLPYVRPGDTDASWAPSGTVEGHGADGLDLVRAMAAAARDALVPGGLLTLQFADSQWETVRSILEESGYETTEPERRPGKALVATATRRPNP